MTQNSHLHAGRLVQGKRAVTWKIDFSDRMLVSRLKLQLRRTRIYARTDISAVLAHYTQTGRRTRAAVISGVTSRDISREGMITGHHTSNCLPEGAIRRSRENVAHAELTNCRLRLIGWYHLRVQGSYFSQSPLETAAEGRSRADILRPLRSCSGCAAVRRTKVRTSFVTQIVSSWSRLTWISL